MRSSKRLIKRGEIFSIILIIVLLIMIPWISSDSNQSNSTVVTLMNLTTSAPVLKQPIPNFTWADNSSYPFAFNLSNYFEDLAGFPLNYTATLADNITVIIDSTNVVSFYSDPEFIGVRNMTITADNGELNTTSNVFYLFVGIDKQAPQWSSPTRSKNNVYQNDFLNLSTIWTDNVMLEGYYFLVNQGGGFENSSMFNFSGRINTSTYRIQISASPGSFIIWRSCAYDTSDNLNCTADQIINISTYPAYPNNPNNPGEGAGAGATEEGGTSAAASPPPAVSKKIGNLSVEPSFLKVSLKQGASETRIIKITNIGNMDVVFNASLLGLSDFVKLSNYENINLSFGKSATITVDFDAKKESIPEEYFGKIKINSGNSVIDIPVVLDITALDLKVDLKLNVLKDYKVVGNGKIVKANLSISNLKDISPDEFTLYCAIKDFEGNIYDSTSEKIKLGSLYKEIKNLTVPDNVKEGEYIFYSRVSNDLASDFDSDTFEVGAKFKLASFIQSFFLLLLIILLLIAAIMLYLRYRRERKKEKLLNLYLMLNELKELIKQEKVDKAIDLFIRLKNMYGEPVSKTNLDKERLKKEIKELSKKLNSEIENLGETAPKPDEKKSDDKKADDKKADDKKADDNKVEDKKTDEKKNEDKKDAK